MWNRIDKWVRFSRVPKIQLAIFLAVIAVSAILFGGQSMSLGSITLAVTTCLISDYIFIRIRRVQPFLLSAALVSGLIIGLLAYPSLPWYYVSLAGLLAMASKNFIKSNNRHVFNPASFGLVVTGLVLRQNVSWWGVIFQSFQPNLFSILLVLILLLPVYVSVFRIHRIKTILSFLVVFSLFQFFRNQSSVLLSPLVLFFSFVMLPEPMTSPNNSRLQILFGISVAILAVIAGYLPSEFIPDSLLVALLTGNLLFFRLRQKYP